MNDYGDRTDNRGQGAEEEQAAWQRSAAAFAAAVESGRLNLPQPGSGATRERWAAFADLAGEDLSLARLAEGHADAVAILAELGGPRSSPAADGACGRRTRPALT